MEHKDETGLDPAEHRGEVFGERAPFSQQVGRFVLIVAALVFVLFALFNAQYVDFSWVFGSTEVVKQGSDRVSGGVPLIALLIAAFLLGAIVGGLLAARTAVTRGRRKERAKDDAEE